jgi:hypothetical protein
MVEYRESCLTCEGVGTVAIESTLTYPEGDPEIKACAECDGLEAEVRAKLQEINHHIDDLRGSLG